MEIAKSNLINVSLKFIIALISLVILTQCSRDDTSSSSGGRRYSAPPNYNGQQPYQQPYQQQYYQQPYAPQYYAPQQYQNPYQAAPYNPYAAPPRSSAYSNPYDFSPPSGDNDQYYKLPSEYITK